MNTDDLALTPHWEAYRDPSAVIDRVFAQNPDIPRTMDAMDFWRGQALAECGGTALPAPVNVVLYNRLRGPT